MFLMKSNAWAIDVGKINSRRAETFPIARFHDNNFFKLPRDI